MSKPKPRECQICGRTFYSWIRSKYCSYECGKEADRRRRRAKWHENKKPPVIFKRNCPVCGKEFETLKSTKIYCSQECKRIENRKAEKTASAVKKCVVCGKEFLTNKPTLIITCSKKCSYIRHLQMGNLRKVRKAGVKICPNCGKKFQQYRSTQKYCSAKCRDAARNERKCELRKQLRLNYRYRNEEYQPIHRDIFKKLLRRLFKTRS